MKTLSPLISAILVLTPLTCGGGTDGTPVSAVPTAAPEPTTTTTGPPPTPTTSSTTPTPGAATGATALLGGSI